MRLLVCLSFSLSLFACGPFVETVECENGEAVFNLPDNDPETITALDVVLYRPGVSPAVCSAGGWCGVTFTSSAAIVSCYPGDSVAFVLR